MEQKLHKNRHIGILEETGFMMRIFDTYLYEISKGTKPAALVTCENALLDKLLVKLNRNNLSYFIQNLDDYKVNIFFGKKECIDVVERFLNKPLSLLSPFEDFILGAILGYDTCIQCKRLLNRYNADCKNNAPVV